MILLLGLWIVAQDTLADEGRARIERSIRATMERAGIPGLSVALVLDKKIAWTAGFGRSDVENDVSAKAATSYRWASVSKPVTATVAMKLVEEGKLDLEEDVRAYVPEWPDKGRKIAIGHLLCHQSGIRHYKAADEINNTKICASLTEALDMFKNDPLEFDPGQGYRYSTFAYTLLGCAIERAAKMKFLDAVKKYVFEPAGMATARDDSVIDLIPNRAQGYVKRDGALRNSALADTSYKIPGGGMCGTAADLARFAIATMDGKLVKPETFQKMSVLQKTADGKETRHGLGWSVQTIGKRKIVGHGGAQQRVSNWVAMVPERGAAVILLCNLEGSGAPLTELSSEILSAALGDK